MGSIMGSIMVGGLSPLRIHVDINTQQHTKQEAVDQCEDHPKTLKS